MKYSNPVILCNFKNQDSYVERKKLNTEEVK